MSEKTSSTGAPAGAEAPPAVPARWSAGTQDRGRCCACLRGEPVDMVARETQVPAHELEAVAPCVLDHGHARAQETG